MLVAEHYSLKPVKVLINNSVVRLELFENSQGNLFLSSGTDTPAGMVYFSTTPSLFYAFLENLITLQTLFNETPSIFVEVKGKEKTALYSLNDIEIKLTQGDKTIKQLTVEHTVDI
jgi:hypothetical protein